MAWERYMQTEGLSQHVCCQHCDSTEKPIAVVTPGRMEQRRQLVCFCTNCWSFTSRYHSKDVPMDISFLNNSIPTRASFIERCPMQKRNIPEGFGDRSQTTSRINSERTVLNLEKQEDRTGAPMSYFAH
jgi:hypothetical protein